MSSKEQLCIVCGKYITYPDEDMVMVKVIAGTGGNAHLVCAWNTKGENK